ncbi:SDR family oxidoreductase [Streptomyces sp. NPDC001156]
MCSCVESSSGSQRPALLTGRRETAGQGRVHTTLNLTSIDVVGEGVLSAVRVTSAALPALQESERPSSTSPRSSAPTRPHPSLHYGAAKAALESWSKGLATQLTPSGIRVNTVVLGMVHAPGAAKCWRRCRGPWAQRRSRRTPRFQAQP